MRLPPPLALLAALCAPAAFGLTVAVDVGHTLARPGAKSARGEPEFAFNRELAANVAQTLSARGYAVQSIGEHGKMQSLQARTGAAANAGFFLSIHHDSVQPQYLSEWTFGGKSLPYSDRFAGFSLFVSRRNPRAAESLACASAIGGALVQAGFKPTRHHAEPIAGENRPFADEANGVYYYDDLVVLRTARQPAALLEAGVILNRDEELALQTPATRQKIADAVANGLKRCLDG